MPELIYRDEKGANLTPDEGDANMRALNMYCSRKSGVWGYIPAIFRLRLAGTGTCVVDAKNALGTITTGLYTYTVTGATNQIEYPYLGDDATQMRVTLTGTCTAGVI
jgi:hypothetical protein